MTGSVVQFSGKALEAQFGDFARDVNFSRSFGRGDEEYAESLPVALQATGALAIAVRPEPALAHGTKAPANRFQGLNS